MIKIIAPIYLEQKFKTKKSKTISLNMNWYRNVYFIINNQMKKKFKEIILKQIVGKKIKTPVEVIYTLYWKRLSDLDNWSSVVTKYLQDALVEEGVIEDDNFNHIVKNTYIIGGKDVKNPRFEILLKEIDLIKYNIELEEYRIPEGTIISGDMEDRFFLQDVFKEYERICRENGISQKFKEIN